MNKGTVTEDDITMFGDKHKQILNEIDNADRCMRSLDITTLETKISQRHVIWETSMVI